MNYSRTNILGLQFRSMTRLRTLSRAEFFTRLQLIRTVEPTVAEAFKISAEKEMQERTDPRERTWHLSFHASQFPGNDPMACPRQAMYRMMDFPDPAPMSRLLRQTADSGLATEAGLVNAWHQAGMLLSSSDPTQQTNFEYSPAWLTGTVDAVICVPGTKKALPVEIKERKAEVIQQMQVGRGPFDEHISQIKIEIALVRYAQLDGNDPLFPGYELADHGIIYYVSRDNPLETAEFRVDFDNDFFVAGIEKLKRWRTYFEEDMIPELKPGKRHSPFGHPHGWRWSYPPCQWCSFKKTCQLDFREGCTTLSESNGVNRAKLVRPDYDAESSRLRVRARWQEKKSETKTS